MGFPLNKDDPPQGAIPAWAPQSSLSFVGTVLLFFDCRNIIGSGSSGGWKDTVGLPLETGPGMSVCVSWGSRTAKGWPAQSRVGGQGRSRRGRKRTKKEPKEKKKSKTRVTREPRCEQGVGASKIVRREWVRQSGGGGRYIHIDREREGGTWRSLISWEKILCGKRGDQIKVLFISTLSISLKYPWQKRQRRRAFSNNLNLSFFVKSTRKGNLLQHWWMTWNPGQH